MPSTSHRRKGARANKRKLLTKYLTLNHRSDIVTYMKYVKMLGIDFTNETLLDILPFGTGYLLREDNTGLPCEHSVTVAMVLQGVDYAIHPHKTMAIDNLPQ